MTVKTSEKKRAYKFVVRGVYRGTDGEKKSKKFFEEEEFILPEIFTYPMGRKFVDRIKYDGDGKPKKIQVSVPDVKKEHILRCYKTVIKNYYLESRLKEKYPDFMSLRTFELTRNPKEVVVDSKFVREVNSIPVSEMKENELILFKAINDLNTELNGFANVEDQRRAVETDWKIKKANDQGSSAGLSQEDISLMAPEGVMVSRGAVTSPDNIPTDDEDIAADLLA